MHKGLDRETLEMTLGAIKDFTAEQLPEKNLLQLDATDEQAIARLERTIHDAHPEVIAIFVKPEAAFAPPLLPGRYGNRAVQLSGLTGKNVASSAR